MGQQQYYDISASRVKGIDQYEKITTNSKHLYSNVDNPSQN